MPTSAPLGTSDLLRLVQEALSEFDSVPLPATIRRTVRVASLLGESKTAIKLGLDLKASGGHPPANAEQTRRLMSDPDEWGSPASEAEEALSEWMAGRRMDDEDKIAGHSIGTLLFWEQHPIPDEEISAAQYESNLMWSLKRIELLERIRHEAFTSLCHWERQLSFSATQHSVLDTVSARVDSLLATRAPDVLEQFNVAFRRLREASSDESGGDVAASEALSQCLTSCRRILKAVVDVVQPANREHKTSEEGHPLTDDKYKNRLFEYLKNNIKSESYLSATEQDVVSLHDRFDVVDSLSSKGVHAIVARGEAEFVALHTYLLAGQVLSVAESLRLDNEASAHG